MPETPAGYPPTAVVTPVRGQQIPAGGSFCHSESENVLLGFLVEEVHQFRLEAVLYGLVAAVDSVEVDIGRRDDDDNILAVGVNMQMQFGAHQLGDINHSVDAVLGQVDMNRADTGDDIGGDSVHLLERFLLVSGQFKVLALCGLKNWVYSF